MNSNIIRVGSESRSETKTYTEKERDSLGRDYADLQSQAQEQENLKMAEYVRHEQELLAIEKRQAAIKKQAAALLPAITKGTVTEIYQCDVYEDGANRIVVRSGFEPTDPKGLIETTVLVKTPPKETVQPVEPTLETEEIEENF